MSKDLIGFEHKGIKIDLKDNGEFVAKVGGKEIVAPSIVAMKKKLDRVEPFKPFEAFSIDWEGDTKTFTVIGVEKHRRYNQYSWRSENGYRHNTVYATTKENVAVAKKLKAMIDAHDKAEKKYEAAKQELQDQLVEAPYPGAINAT
jgi:hypothetical protein